MFCRRVFAASDVNEPVGGPSRFRTSCCVYCTLIKSYRLFISFSFCHLIILWAFAAGCSNGTLDASCDTSQRVGIVVLSLYTFEPWWARIDDITRYELLFCYHNCTGAKLHVRSYLYPLPVNCVTLSCVTAEFVVVSPPIESRETHAELLKMLVVY